ncbi:MAG TPA: hypothetical protein VJK02_10230, partial [Anaerolineales bacterium]|nr:hypothetical protein [Anaerolineales bacterium]
VPGAPLISRAAGQTAQGPSRIDSLQRALERNRLRRWETSLGQKDLFEQYTRVILELTRRYPILIILDDLQWADSNSLALLFHLSRRAGDARLLLLGASRLIGGFEDSSQAERMLADLLSEIRRNYGDSHIDLGRTQEEEGESFIDAILDTESNALDPAFRRELFRHTGANPLFTIELLRAMEARGDIVQDDDHLWTPGPSLDWRQLPAKVEGVIEERLNKIGDELREILRVAAVEGGSFTAEVISQVLRLEIRDLLRQLGGKLDRQYRLVEPLGSRHLAEARLSLYRFRHILFQKHIYGRLDPAEKAYLHEDVGRALETAHHGQSGEISVQLAWHFAEAGLARRAIDYLIQAAAQARRLSAFQESASHLRRALSLVDSLPRGNESLQVELDLQTALGVSLVGAAGYAADEVGKAYARGRELCLELGGSPQLFPVLYGLRTFHLVRAEYGSALEHGQQLLSIGQTQQDPELLVEAHQALGTNLFYLGDFQAAAQHLKRCLDLYDLDRDLSHAARFGQDPAVACLSYLALTSWLLGQTALAIQQRDKALQHAETIAHPFSMAFALCFAGLLFRLEGDADSARRCAGEAEALSTARGFPFWAAMASILQGTILADAGHKEGIQHIQTGLGAWAGGGSRLGRPYYLGLLAEALARWGEDTLALATVEEAIEESTRTGERLSLADLHRWRGIFLARSGRKADARRSLRQALEVAREQNSPLFEARAAMSLFKVLEGAEGSSEFLGEVIARLSPHLSYPELLEAQVMLKSDPE